jgi:hypothetical protein
MGVESHEVFDRDGNAVPFEVITARLEEVPCPDFPRLEASLYQRPGMVSFEPELRHN